jgi:hypothetical protein
LHQYGNIAFTTPPTASPATETQVTTPQPSPIRAQLWAADSMPLGPWPPRPFAMSRKVYERHIRKLIKIEGAINTLERVASPAYRRERERNRDGSFVTQYDQLEMR